MKFTARVMADGIDVLQQFEVDDDSDVARAVRAAAAPLERALSINEGDLMTSKSEYQSQVEMGERYRDSRTGFEGVVTSVTFYEHACERVVLETFDQERQRIVTEVFDAPRLERASTGEKVTTERTGGDRPMPGQAAIPGR